MPTRITKLANCQSGGSEAGEETIFIHNKKKWKIACDLKLNLREISNKFLLKNKSYLFNL